MKFFKKLGWQLLSLLVHAINLARKLGVLYCLFLFGKRLFLILKEAFTVESFQTIQKAEWLYIVLFLVLAAVLHFLKQSVQNILELLKDKIRENTSHYYSKEKLMEFKKNMANGFLDPYTLEEIISMKDYLEAQGEQVVINSENAGYIEAKRLGKEYDFSQEYGSDNLDDLSRVEKEEKNPEKNEEDEKIISTEEIDSYTKKGVENPMLALNTLIGLDSVKEEVRKMQSRYQLELQRKAEGKQGGSISGNHMCFYGPAGTGKTTVARIMAGILYDLKMIHKNQVVEISGNDLKGSYTGWTAIKTKRIIEAAKGGVLFIDEAYSLIGDNYWSDGYGDEALAQLITAMENYKDELVVIFAGYEAEMSRFLDRNEGLKSRIKTFIHFPNYTAEDMGEILVSLAEQEGLKISPELKAAYVEYAERVLVHSSNFGNARDARNSLAEIYDQHSLNVTNHRLSPEMRDVLCLEDFPWEEGNETNQKDQRNLWHLTKDEERIISMSELEGYIKPGIRKPMEELERLIGLQSVKTQIRNMRNRYLFELSRKEDNVTSDFMTCNHMCFCGPPGTGKTTVARIMSGILYDLKIIKKNQVVEVGGNDLVGQYIGDSAKKTKLIIEASKGGVLFIDEAYTLNTGYKGYGDEVLGELVKAMEDFKDDLVVIFAGYEKEMKDFLKRNPGMQSRIKSEIYFPNYTPDELGEIFVSMAKTAQYKVSEKLKDTYIDFAEKVLLPDPSFGNARTVRQDLDKIIERHATNYVEGRIGEEDKNRLVLLDFPWFKDDVRTGN